MDEDPPEIALVVVETEYACGAKIGFVARTTEIAARKAAAIMTDVCPECKKALGEELTADEREILSLGPDGHTTARSN